MASVSSGVPLTAPSAQKLLQSVKYILLDVDGVVWSGPRVLPNIPQTLQYLRSLGKEIRFLTNNASVSRSSLAQLFRQRGIEGVKESEVYNSGYAAALRLRRICGAAEGNQERQEGNEPTSDKRLVRGNVFVIGEEGLHEELQRVLAPGYITYGMELHDAEKVGGYNSANAATAWKERILPAPLRQLKPPDGITDYGRGISLTDLSPVAVVVGLDLHFNMLKLAYASLCLHRGAGSNTDSEGDRIGGDRDRTPDKGLQKPVCFIATNEDPQIPIGEEGLLLPGAGGMVSALRTVSGRNPDAVCGKPHVDMARIMFEAEGITDARQCLMVGDRLTTDIAFGNAAGCRTLFVLSGAESMADIARAKSTGDSQLLPEFVAPSLASLMPDARDD
ncbi:p-nitrophenylphosphatase, putative [Trypanosoma equiperdum]|uniref:p-nitrophenylphosphatase, putative n=3 Tax=Trypanozoon TaxID=39700 RepID=Q57V72_TRYB2|nr:p-nitrophenylphosphatase, putative [Trypanosoma brucei brucei TREU927]AAX70477.1 p-nitrophenylphosphatase, putative [Trypanosoma brucei]AAZ13514.1 p-nitrophenylphosphatase, putative [Trypanosoma brucei brucei TREU927]RHW72872.1 p-nitrophenylphosphatase [Trypanosoma brucei equiperdum]SCU72967.1 p-nitrophenylphosphatase, putative [Trypanosoma equiperdum]